MSINVTPSMPLARRPLAVVPAQPAPVKSVTTPRVAGPMVSPLPKETSKQRFQEKLALFVDWVGKVPLLRKAGIKVYGMNSKIKPGQADLANLGTLSPTVMRGAQPTDTGFKKLAAQGVKTVINLRVEQSTEGPAVKAAGLNYLYMPMPAVGPPLISDGLAFLSAATDPANGKVYFHCQHGADRTGAMAAIYRMTVQGKTVDQAIAEMPRYGFHEGFEDEKVVFVRQFAKFWATVPAARKAAILHQGV